MSTKITIDQSTRCPIRVVQLEKYAFRYANDRAAESQRSNSKGQDYLTIRYDENYLGFVIADGVSQSFFGELASQIIGDHLLSHMMEFGERYLDGSLIFQTSLETELNNMAYIATPMVNAFQMPASLPGMLVSVLEQKRQMGSQATFTTGFIDITKRKLALAWMGDERLRIWRDLQEISREVLGDETFQTAERWSTSIGMVGKLHTKIIHDPNITRLVAYSDGLSILDREMQINPVSHEKLEALILQTSQMPQSDDVTIFELAWKPDIGWETNQTTGPEDLSHQFDSGSGIVKIEWKPIKGFNSYQIATLSSQGQQITDTQSTSHTFKADELPKDNLRFSVRASSDAKDLTQWSKILELGNYVGASGWEIPPKAEMRAVGPTVIKTPSLFHDQASTEGHSTKDTYPVADNQQTAQEHTTSRTISTQKTRTTTQRSSNQTHKRQDTKGKTENQGIPAGWIIKEQEEAPKKNLMLLWITIPLVLLFLLTGTAFGLKKMSENKAFLAKTQTRIHKPSNTPVPSLTTTPTDTPSPTQNPTDTTTPTTTKTPTLTLVPTNTLYPMKLDVKCEFISGYDICFYKWKPQGEKWLMTFGTTREIELNRLLIRINNAEYRCKQLDDPFSFTCEGPSQPLNQYVLFEVLDKVSKESLGETLIKFYNSLPTSTPVTPTKPTVVPSDTPVTPTEQTVVPSDTPVTPTEQTVVPSDTPVTPTEQTVVPSDTPVTPSPSTPDPPTPNQNNVDH